MEKKDTFGELMDAIKAAGIKPSAELSSAALMLAAGLHVKSTDPKESAEIWQERCVRAYGWAVMKP